MIANWNISRRPENMDIPEWEKIKTPEMQYRRELTLMYQEAALQHGFPLYGVTTIENLKDAEDKKKILDLVPEAKSIILLGTPIEDPWNRLWHRVAGLSMDNFTSIAASSVELMLLTFVEKLDYQGYKSAYKILPLTPTNEFASLFESAGAGFIGKNHLVITEEFGCRVCLGFIVSNAPLLHGDYRYKNFSSNICGDCTICEEYCPSGALKKGNYDQKKCEQFINDPENQIKISPHSVYKCDTCMRVCPIGNKKKWDTQLVHWNTILTQKKLIF